MPNAMIRKLVRSNYLTEPDIRLLMEITGSPHHVGRKQDLIKEGDKPEFVQLILSGFACRYKVVADGSRQILAYLVPGDFCDLHVAILGEMDHSIASLSDCTAVEIPRRTIEMLTDDHPRIARAFWWATLVDEAVLREWIAGLGRRSADRHMAHLFCELHARLEAVGLVEGQSFELPITQEELGDALGISIVHTNRMLMQLRDNELLCFRDKRVTIVDLPRLHAFGEFTPNYLHLNGTARPGRISRQSH